MKTIQEMLDRIECSMTLAGMECIGSENNALLFISANGESTYKIQITQESF